MTQAHDLAELIRVLNSVKKTCPEDLVIQLIGQVFGADSFAQANKKLRRCQAKCKNGTQCSHEGRNDGLCGKHLHNERVFRVTVANQVEMPVFDEYPFEPKTPPSFATHPQKVPDAPKRSAFTSWLPRFATVKSEVQAPPTVLYPTLPDQPNLRSTTVRRELFPSPVQAQEVQRKPKLLTITEMAAKLGKTLYPEGDKCRAATLSGHRCMFNGREDLGGFCKKHEDYLPDQMYE